MIRSALTSSVVTLLTSLAIAQPATTQSPAPHGTRGHRAQDASSLQAVQAAKVSLIQALETAESKGQGRAVDARFKVEGGKAQYEIKVLGAEGKLVEHHVDATSGLVIKSESHPVEAFFRGLKPTTVQSAGMTLRQAVAAAEQKASGRAVKAEIEHEGNALRYEVTVVAGGRAQKVKVGQGGEAVMTN